MDTQMQVYPSGFTLLVLNWFTLLVLNWFTLLVLN
jgi:hypothetical protein